jgi:hypothetical protein
MFFPPFGIFGNYSVDVVLLLLLEFTKHDANQWLAITIQSDILNPKLELMAGQVGSGQLLVGNVITVSISYCT